MKTIIPSLLFLTKYSESSGGHWNYNHMDHWSHDYSMCGTLDQSPINIDTEHSVVYDKSVCGPELNWTVDWSIHAFKISNNGHSVVLQPVTRIDWDPDVENEGTVEDEYGRQYTTLSVSENSIGKLPNYFKPSDSPHTDFCLHSFHFHWGLLDDEGSEHLVDDEAYPLEVHFVHYSCQHATLGTTLGAYPDLEAVERATADGTDVHELAVVGIFFDITEYDNPAFDVMFGDDTFDDILYPGGPTTEIIDGLYLQDLIPEGVFTDGYYSYEGSLTTPPCTPIVRWHVSNTRSYIGKKQMDKMRKLMATHNTTSAPNYRIPQYNEHTVYACMDPESDEVIVNETERAIIVVYAVFIICCMGAFGAICYCKSKRQSEITAASPNNRQRVKSHSHHHSVGDHTPASPTTPDGGHHTGYPHTH